MTTPITQRKLSYSLVDLSYAVGRAHFVLGSFHPKANEISIVEEAFLQRFRDLLETGHTTLNDEPFFLTVPNGKFQVVKNFADYLELDVAQNGEDSYILQKRKA